MPDLENMSCEDDCQSTQTLVLSAEIETVSACPKTVAYSPKSPSPMAGGQYN
jgi:hypothetical protein